VALKLGVAGGLGRMGREVVLLAISRPKEFTLVAAGVPEGSKDAGKRVGQLIHLDSNAAAIPEKQFKAALRRGEFSVLIDVTGADSAEGYMMEAVEGEVPFVSGSTGVPKKSLERVAHAAEKAGVPGVWTPNFSLGVNVWWAAVAKVAKLLPNYDVEVVEIHHGQKKDAPSGTAKHAVELVQQATGVDKLVHGRSGITGARGREIGIHAVRLGDVVGDHTVFFSSNAERIELTHRAHTRMAFAAGALVAAHWVAHKKGGGLFSMADVLGISMD
jgi:4-hydroxy-tetrahydrodipicolinate reductase